jgi:hypothetical protein
LNDEGKEVFLTFQHPWNYIPNPKYMTLLHPTYSTKGYFCPSMK